jgi:TorA maturation chaperone TorD
MSATEPASLPLAPLAAAAAAASALAAFWGEPDMQALRRWRSAALHEDLRLVADALGCGEDLLEPMREALRTPHRILAEEYERLCVGPGTVPCPPYEALWRKDRPKLEQGTVYGAVTGKVADLYDEIGVRVRPELRELPDHIAAEWEAVAYALTLGPTERLAAKDLLAEHLAVWLPPFLRRVEDSQSRTFYLLLAQLTGLWQPAILAILERETA